MKTLICKALTLGLFAAAITGCRKDDATTDNSKNAIGLKSTFGSIVNANQPQQHVFNINAATGGTIIGKNTRLTFGPNAFITAQGSAVTGSVQVELREISEKWQMVLANKTTVSTQGLLESSGEAYINATQNGQKLRLRAGTSKIQFAASSMNKPMNFFTGNIDADNMGEVTWVLNDSIPTDTAEVDCSCDTVATVYVDNNTSMWDTLYTFPLDTMGWINCDYIMNAGIYPAALKLTTSEGFDNTNTRVYLVFKNRNSVGNMNYYADGAFVTDAIHGYDNIPVGEQMTIIAVGYKDDKLYSAFKTITLSASNNESLSLTETTSAAFETAVKNL